MSATYSGNTEEGTVIDNSSEGITVSAKYTDGDEAKSLAGWDVENPSPLVAGQTTTYTIKFSDYTCELPITCTTPSMTIGQKNALAKGKDYLSYTAFSYSGLIEQLQYDGFSVEDATYAADNCGADWNAQAAKKAQDYLDYSSFSREGLIEQLKYDGFSAEQAEYGATTVGPFSRVGGEVSNSVLFAYSNKGHDGFLGNSVLGEWCNIGADSNNSNLKNNYEEVKLWSYETESFAKTGLQFCGLMMGDHSKCGINTMFNTGTVVGVSTNIFGSGFPRNFVPSFSWGGAAGFTTYVTKKAFETARIVMSRRNVEFDEKEARILEHVFEETKKWRKD